MLALDGVVSGDVERGVRFHEATGLEARDAGALARTVQFSVLRWFACPASFRRPASIGIATAGSWLPTPA